MFGRFVAVAVGVVIAEAQCPGSGVAQHGRCWYLGEAGAACKPTCAAQGLTYSWHVGSEADPMLPKLLGRTPATKQFSWGRTECYVPSADRFHTAKNVADSNAGDSGDAGDWKVDICRLSCPCSQGVVPSVESTEAYPKCAQKDLVLRHAGAHAIFVDVSGYGSSGCWQNDCKNSDKFDAADMGMCARACGKLPECTHWSYGEQGGVNKCFFRKSDGGRENAEGWVSGSRSCAPPELPDAFMALTAGELLKVCDAGKSDACPDMARAVTTWKFAIKHLKKATEGSLDANTQQYVAQIGTDTDAFAAQMSEENFPVIAGNNRQVFNALGPWMASQPKAVVDPTDMSVPNPMRGLLCGPSTCYDKV